MKEKFEEALKNLKNSMMSRPDKDIKILKGAKNDAEVADELIRIALSGLSGDSGMASLYAVDVLGELMPEKALPPLVRIALSDIDILRSEASSAIQKYGAKAVPALLDALGKAELNKSADEKEEEAGETDLIDITADEFLSEDGGRGGDEQETGIPAAAIDDEQAKKKMYSNLLNASDSELMEMNMKLRDKLLSLKSVFEVTMKLNSISDVKTIKNILVFGCLWQAQSSSCILFLKDPSGGICVPSEYNGVSKEDIEGIYISGDIISYFERIHEPSTYRELSEALGMKSEVLFLESIKTEMIFPLFVKDAIIGFLTLGPRQNGDNYTDDDREILSILVNFGAVSLYNGIKLQEQEAQK